MNVDFTVRLRGQTASLLNALVREGYSESKTEAVRTALILYAVQLGLVTKRQLHAEALKAVKASGRSYADAEIASRITAVR